MDNQESMDKLVTCCFLEFTKQLREGNSNTIVIVPNARDNEINLMTVSVANAFAFFTGTKVFFKMPKIKYLLWKILYHFPNQMYKDVKNAVEIVPCEFAHIVCKNSGVRISTFISTYKEYYELQTKRRFLKWGKL